MDVDKLWIGICNAFPFLELEDILVCEAKLQPLSERDIVNLANLLKEHEMLELVEEMILGRIKKELREYVAPEFWNSFVIKESLVEGFKKFYDSVQVLNRNVYGFMPTIQRLIDLRNAVQKEASTSGDHNLKTFLKAHIVAVLYSQLPPPNRLLIIEQFYRLSFKSFSFSVLDLYKDLNESNEDALHCNGCSALSEECFCSSIMANFLSTNEILIDLNLLQRLTGEILTKLMDKLVEAHVHETCKGSFDVSYIGPLQEWLDGNLVKWLDHFYQKSKYPDVSSLSHIYKSKLKHLLYETYTKTRIDQLFNIIIEYPDSEPAVEDLKTCLEKTDLKGELAARLRASLEARLLRPGVNTPDIITAFGASIRALRHLDPTGVLLDTITKPISQYLRSREDTVRCVVLSLTEEGPGELAEELIREDNEYLETQHWLKWVPDPVDAQAPKSNKNNWDIISMLVNVYGSKDMFVNEYKNLLADRLLTQFSYNTDKEIRYLELLKLRFDDSKLHQCDVMLKDIHDSKRISTHLFSDPNFSLSNQPIACTAMILSAQFWPPFKEETLELPPVIKELFNTYTKAFETFKGNRTLNWKPHLGSVNLDIELKGRTINLNVNPVQATIIWYFQEKDTWTVEELSRKIHVTPTLLRRRIAFWQYQF